MHRKNFFPEVQANLPALNPKKENETTDQHHFNETQINLNSTQTTELLSCHQKLLSWKKNFGVCLFNQEHISFFACEMSKKEMEKQQLKCGELFQKIKSGR